VKDIDKANGELVEKRRELVAQVKQVVIDSLQLDLVPDEIAEDGMLFGFGLALDSIDALTLAVAVEERFQIPIPDDEVTVFRSVNTITDFVSGYASANAR
jgi:acyl carrier protein